jgi:putative heme degradation protein
MSRRSAELVAAEIGARVVELDPLARDWLQNLRHIAEALHEALA